MTLTPNPTQDYSEENVVLVPTVSTDRWGTYNSTTTAMWNSTDNTSYNVYGQVQRFAPCSIRLGLESELGLGSELDYGYS